MWLATPSTSDRQTPSRVAGAVLNAGTSSFVGNAKASSTQEIRTEGTGGRYSTLAPRDMDARKVTLFHALAAAKILTSRVAMAMESDWRAYLFDQLDQLHDPEDWEEHMQPVQTGSVLTFLRSYIAWHPQFKPALGLSDRGNILAAWRRDESERLTLEFLPQDLLTYVVAARDGDAVRRHSGTARVQSLHRFLIPFPQVNWFTFEAA